MWCWVQVIEHLTCRSLSNLTQEERSSLNEVSDLKKITSPKEDGDDQSVEEKESKTNMVKIEYITIVELRVCAFGLCS